MHPASHHSLACRGLRAGSNMPQRKVPEEKFQLLQGLNHSFKLTFVLFQRIFVRRSLLYRRLMRSSRPSPLLVEDSNRAATIKCRIDPSLHFRTVQWLHPKGMV